jgi:hypothetical protein
MKKASSFPSCGTEGILNASNDVQFPVQLFMGNYLVVLEVDSEANTTTHVEIGGLHQ